MKTFYKLSFMIGACQFLFTSMVFAETEVKQLVYCNDDANVTRILSEKEVSVTAAYLSSGKKVEEVYVIKAPFTVSNFASGAQGSVCVLLKK